jgi:pheromone shutdown-related protein TraB
MAPENLKIIGTAHVSEKSVEEVRETIINEKPDVVAIELCANRYYSMLAEKNGEEKKDPSIKELIKGNNLTLFFVSSFLSYFQRKIGDDLGVKPGSEMLAAIEAAEETGAKIALIDRDIQVTLKRAMNQMSIWEKMKFFYGFIASFFAKDDEIEDVESIKEGDMLEEVMEYFREVSPKAYHVLVTERNGYMAQRLLDIDAENVVAVVGAGHKEGITECMNHPEKIPPLQELMTLSESRISLGKIFLYSIPVLFILIFIGAFLSGINLKTSLLQYVLLTGGLAFLGSLLAGSKIYSAVTAFLVAPITAIHPLLAAGWFAGIVEAKFRHVSMEDMHNITKCESFRELLQNNLFRVLLVVVGANIGCSIGTFISIPDVIYPLFSKIIGL